MKPKKVYRRRTIGMERTTVTGRIVYDRKSRPFILPRVAKIFTKLMQKYNEVDPATTSNDRYIQRAAPTSTIYFFFQTAYTWLSNRGEIERIFGGNLLFDIERIERMDNFNKKLEEFYQQIDIIMAAIKTGLDWLRKLVPPLEWIIKIDLDLIDVYQKVRAAHPFYVTEEPQKEPQEEALGTARNSL